MCDNLMCSLEECNIPYSTCHCGCGEITSIVAKNHSKDGHIKGYPYLYMKGHYVRNDKLEYKVDNNTGCWVWLGSMYDRGYGRKKVSGKYVLAHKLYYEKYNGSVPEGLEIDHLCRNHSCVNPNHLEAVTHIENVGRGLLVKVYQKEAEEIKLLCGIPGGLPQKDVAEIYGISSSTVYRIVSNKRRNYYNGESKA